MRLALTSIFPLGVMMYVHSGVTHGFIINYFKYLSECVRVCVCVYDCVIVSVHTKRLKNVLKCKL